MSPELCDNVKFLCKYFYSSVISNLIKIMIYLCGGKVISFCGGEPEGGREGRDWKRIEIVSFVDLCLFVPCFPAFFDLLISLGQ